jgi:hypothetical protein
MVEIDIIPLAMRKAVRRGIAIEWVEETVRIPEQVVDGYGGRKVAQRKMNREGKEYLLRVVYEETSERITVVTAYLTSQVNRYWRGAE